MTNAFETAVLLHGQNRLTEAEAQYRAVLTGVPAHAGALHRLGLLCIQTGRIGEAEPLLRRAAAAAPDAATIRHHLALLLLKTGRAAEALGEAQAALAHGPDFADAWNTLGLAQAALGHEDEARAALERAQLLSPRDPNIAESLGEVALRQDEPAAALPHFDKALTLKPGMTPALIGRSEALAGLDRHDEALAAAEEAVARDPRYAAAQRNLGAVLKQMGRMAEAETAFARAVQLAPDMPSYHRALGDMRRYTAADPRLAALESLAAREAELAEVQKVELQFALFKAYDDLGAYGAAFAHLARGNALNRQRLPYDEAALQRFFAALMRNFAAATVRQTSDNKAALPIFIVGMPRSGTSLVEQILASHPAVFGAGERTWIGALAGELLPDYPDNITAEAVAALGRRYLARLQALAPNATRITDKLPANFRHLGLIHRALPGARLIHIRRDPRDTCFSCYSKLFRNGLNFAYDQRELGRYYKAYERLMAHWRAVLPKGILLEVEYERLVAEFETQCRRIVDFCGLAWDERVLRFHENARAVRTLSELQVRKPLFSDSIGRWQRYEAFLGPLLEALS